jgi:hypothetical protein
LAEAANEGDNEDDMVMALTDYNSNVDITIFVDTLGALPAIPAFRKYFDALAIAPPHSSKYFRLVFVTNLIRRRNYVMRLLGINSSLLRQQPHQVITESPGRIDKP